MEYTKLKISNSLIGRNTEGTIFKTNNKDIVYKRLHEKISTHEFLVPSEGLVVPNFSMPLYIKRDKNNNIEGYYKDYIEGETMDYKYRDLDFKKVIGYVSEFDKSVDKLSKRNIIMHDLTSGNFVVTNNSIHNIDVDRFEYMDENSFESRVKKTTYKNKNIEYSLLKENRSYFAQYILARFGIYRFNNLEEEYENYDSMIKEIAYLVRYGVVPAETLINVLKDYSEQVLCEEIVSVQEFIRAEEKVRKLKKSGNI